MGFRSEFSTTFKILLSSKWIKLAITVNFFYLIGGIIYYYLCQSGFTAYGGNDFNVFFRAGYLAINDIDKLYDSTQYTFPFRYLPLTAYIFSIFSFIPQFETLIYWIFMLINFLLNIPIIIITGYGSDRNYSLAQSYGVTDFLSKPCSVVEISRAIDSALSQSKNA